MALSDDQTRCHHKNNYDISLARYLVSLHVLLNNTYKKAAQLSQRDRAAGWDSYGQKWKTGTGKQYLRTLQVYIQPL